MDELQIEKTRGLSLAHLVKAAVMRLVYGKKFHTPGFGLAAQLFASVAKEVLNDLGPEKGEALLQRAIENFGRERGRRIAAKVKERGKPLSLRNWIIHTDIDPVNFRAEPDFPDGDLRARVTDCTFIRAAEDWGMKEYAAIYCKYADYAILDGYNPDVKLVLKSRHETGEDHCVFRYILKEDNK